MLTFSVSNYKKLLGWGKSKTLENYQIHFSFVCKFGLVWSLKRLLGWSSNCLTWKVILLFGLPEKENGITSHPRSLVMTKELQKVRLQEQFSTRGARSESLCSVTWFHRWGDAVLGSSLCTAEQQQPVNLAEKDSAGLANHHLSGGCSLLWTSSQGNGWNSGAGQKRAARIELRT